MEAYNLVFTGKVDSDSQTYGATISECVLELNGGSEGGDMDG